MNWEKIRKEYETSSITMKELAEKHGAKLGTLKSRASREKWLSNHDKKVATKKATERKKVATKKVEKIIESNSELKGWEIQFCYEYIKSWNATKSYMKARDVAYSTAAVEGSKLLRKPNIIKAIKDIKKETDTELLISVEDIKREYFKQSFADVTDFVEYGANEIQVHDKHGDPLMNTNGELVTYKDSYVNFKDMSEIDGRLIKEVRMGKDGPVIQLYDKQKAMQELLKLMAGGDDENTGVVFVDNEEAMNQYMTEHGEAYAD